MIIRNWCVLLTAVLVSAHVHAQGPRPPVASAQAAAQAVLESLYAPRDFALQADPQSADWRVAPLVTIAQDYLSQPIAGRPTEVRSRWTNGFLYLLFACPYDTLNLKPGANPAVETPSLWTWDVAEAFIGWDVERITRYKELQVSPQGEWVDLDIDRENPRTQAGMAWNSGYAVVGRIDEASKVWYGAMQIPFGAIDTRVPRVNSTLRIGLYRISGAEPARTFWAWQPTGQKNFHVPQAFGTLRLVQ